MNEFYNKYKDIYNYSTNITKRMYRKYKSIFFYHNIDLQDLIQESHIVTTKMLRKCCHEEKLKIKRVISKYVGFMLNEIRKKLINTAKPFSLEELYEYVDPEKCNAMSVEHQVPPFIFGDLKYICSDLEYKILHKKYIENKTMEEIGKDLNYTNQRIYQLYSNILNKLKNHFNSN